MQNYALSAVFAVFACLNAPALFAQRNPLGESAHYEIDRDRDRTSNSIRYGDATASVTEQIGDTAFKVNLNYEIHTTIFGTKSGDAPTNFPNQFFSEQFLVDLRASGHFENEKLKIDYLGSGDVQTMNGTVYKDCDYIRIYDVQGMKNSPKYSSIYDFAVGLLRSAGGPEEGDVEDLVIEAPIKYGVPVIGAVKIDVSGILSGLRLKAGLDYQP